MLDGRHTCFRIRCGAISPPGEDDVAPPWTHADHLLDAEMAAATDARWWQDLLGCVGTTRDV
jgi:hypothetical protein